METSSKGSRSSASWKIYATLIFLMAAMGGYMVYIMSYAQKIPVQPRLNLFPDLSDRMMDLHDGGYLQAATFENLDEVNGLLSGTYPDLKIQLQQARGFEPKTGFKTDVGGKDLVAFHFRKKGAPPVTLGLFPIAKKYLPETTRVSSDNLVFHLYGWDSRERLFIPVEDADRAAREAGIYLIGANFLNSFFVFGLSHIPAADLAELVEDMLDFDGLNKTLQSKDNTG